MLRKLIVWSVKILVAVLAYGYVVYRLVQQDYTQFSLLWSNGVTYRGSLVLLVLLLIPLNWTLEAGKWKYALRKIYPIGFKVALKSALYGAGVGLFTPNKMGDPIGRAAILGTSRKTEAGFAAFQCAFAQQLATLMFGIAGIILLRNRVQFAPYFHNPWVSMILFFAFGITLLLVFGQKWVAKIVEKFAWIRRKGFSSDWFLEITWQDALVVLLISLTRYLVFSTQFVLMLYVFGFPEDILTAYTTIFCTYLFASFVPALSIADAGVRSSFAIIFVGAFWNQPTAITLAAHIVWVVNAALPALGGVLLPFFKKGEW